MTDDQTPDTPQQHTQADTAGAQAPQPASTDALPEVTLGQAATATAPEPQPKGPAEIRESWGTGRRKSSICRVRIRPGDGKFVVNGKPFEQYFCLVQDRNTCMEPLMRTQYQGKVDVLVRANGGGTTGQAGAVQLGLARALRTMDSSIEGILRDGGMLTRDGRMKERKKYGQRGARRRFQFSKR